MAGHSQFKNIMFRKGKQDKERSKLFSKLAREITVAAKAGLPDPAHNARLRTAIIAAKAESMPKDNIERAIKKAGGSDAENYDEIRYEGRGPGGVAIIVEAMTDNRNRTSADVRSTFSKYGGAMGETGSVSFMFDHVGRDRLSPGQGQRGRDAGSRRWKRAPTNASRRRTPTNSSPASKASPPCAMRWKPSWARPAPPPSPGGRKNTVAVTDDAGESLMKLIEMLDDHDDVQNVYGNYELSDALMAKLAG